MQLSLVSQPLWATNRVFYWLYMYIRLFNFFFIQQSMYIKEWYVIILLFLFARVDKYVKNNKISIFPVLIFWKTNRHYISNLRSNGKRFFPMEQSRCTLDIAICNFLLRIMPTTDCKSFLTNCANFLQQFINL